MKKHKFENGLTFVSLSKHQVPVFGEVRGKEWIKYGADNLYPDFLIGLSEDSATHGAVLGGKVGYVLGEGWAADTKGLNLTARAKLNAFISAPNPEENLNELSEPVIDDFETFNGFYLEIIEDKSGRDFSMYHMPFNKIRTNDDESKYFYSDNWAASKQTPEKTGFEEYAKFDPNKRQKKSIFSFRILSKRKGKDPNVYPLPNYVNGIAAIRTEIAADNFNLMEIKSGFSAGTMINFYNGIPTKNEQKEIKSQITEQLTGDDRAGEFILNFADGKDRGSEVVSLNGNDLPERYSNVRKDASSTIFTVHKVSSPELFGVMQENVTFGGRSQIAEQYELFQNTYVSKRQMILEKVFNDFVNLKGVSGRLQLIPTKALSTDVFSEAVIVQSLPAKAIQDIIAARMGVDLSQYKDAPVVTVTEDKREFSEDIQDPVLKELLKCGRSKDLFKVQQSKDYNFISEEEQEEQENALLPPPPSNVDRALERKGLIEIVYSYELRADAPSLKGESREFCDRLVNSNLFFTRQEINAIPKPETSTSVWLYKGGWYNNPTLKATTKHCRHIWQQHIVILK